MLEVENAWRPTRQLSPTALWGLWCTCLVATPAALVVQQVTAVPGVGESGADGLVVVRLSSLVAFLWLLMVWLWTRTRPDRLLLVGATAALWLGVATATWTALGVAPVEAGREGAATLVQASVTLAYYRWRIGDDNLTPHRPADVASLLGASLVGALAAAPVSPAFDTLRTTGRLDVGLAAWLLAAATCVFVGAATLLLLVQRRPRDEALPTRLRAVYALLVVIALTGALDISFPELPLSWTVLLPAIWAGLLMGPWTAAALSLSAGVAIVTATIGTASARDSPRGAAVEVLLVECLMAAFVLVALVLSLVRDQRAHLAQEVVQRRLEAVEQAGLLQRLLESLDEALLLVDTEGRVQLHNRSASALLGDRLASEPAKWLGHPVSTSARFSYPFAADDHAPRIVSVQLAPVQYAGADGVMAVARDVTTEHHRIEELASFAAVAAHDLKSPLAAVEGWLEVAEDALDHDVLRSRHALGRGRAAASRMASEIDDWLAYTVAREGELSPEPVALTPLLQEISGAHPGVDFGFACPDVVRGDRTLLRHLLSNLVGNAVKYTMPGETPRVSVHTTLQDDGWVRVAVVDEGIGIPAGEEVAVFEPFRRASTVTGSYEGSGLGLALCKRIVRRHGGAIAATANPSRGTTITVTLPAAPSDDARRIG